LSKHRISLIVNTERVDVEVPANRMLSELLRDDLLLTGTKRGCETGVCGACSVLLNGDLVKSCLSLAVQADGCDITTIEGLGSEAHPHPLQESFVVCGGLQCGYCTPGFLMASCALLAKHPAPTEKQVRDALSGNLCRCTGYVHIVQAVLIAAEKLRGN
jgi:carbon-monoxide dehydrogenase small subunit